MKKAIVFLTAILLLTSCKHDVIAKPDKLIEEDKMVDIIYDLAILEAIRSQHQSAEDEPINPREYVYKKYHIDSLQFAQSNHYYASDIGNYKKMYGKVNDRIMADQLKADAEAAKAPASGKPTPVAAPDKGVIK